MDKKCECSDECKCTDEAKCSDECSCNEQVDIKKSKTTATDDCHCKEKSGKKGLWANKKVKELEDKINELKDKDLRQKAEFVNYRRRKDEETSKMLKYSNEDIVKELLPNIDNLERAINMDDDNLNDEVSKFLTGFKMIYCNLTSILEKYGVSEIEALNKEFDPKIHQAVITEEKEDVKSGIVIEVLQKGYLLKDRVIRPAMVKVSK